jgi:ubiquitin-protein ligase
MVYQYDVPTPETYPVSPPAVGLAYKNKVVRPGGCSSYETSECQEVLVTVLASYAGKPSPSLASLKTR